MSKEIGGVDERAAFEAWYETTYGISLEPEFRANHFIGYVNDKANHRWTAWQARAALSAPSHGEQVRDGWQLVPVEPTREMVSAASGAITTPDDMPPVGVGGWSMSDLAFRSRYRAALAADPSAGSQKEGE